MGECRGVRGTGKPSPPCRVSRHMHIKIKNYNISIFQFRHSNLLYAGGLPRGVFSANVGLTAGIPTDSDKGMLWMLCCGMVCRDTY